MLGRPHPRFQRQAEKWRPAAADTGGSPNRRWIVIDTSAGSMRSVEFGPPATLGARDWPVGLAVRDVWQVTDERPARRRRARRSQPARGGAPSGASRRSGTPRCGRQTPSSRPAYGSFVGNLPLAVPAFGDYPSRHGSLVRSDQRPARALEVAACRRSARCGCRKPSPRCSASSVRSRRTLDAQVSFTHRRSSDLATFRVPSSERRCLLVESGGLGSYHELQISARRTWAKDQQLFVSYVRSAATGELNDFTAVFQGMDSPLVQPGGVARADDRRAATAC